MRVLWIVSILLNFQPYYDLFGYYQKIAF